MLLRGKTTEFQMKKYVPFLLIASYTSTGVGFPIRFAYRSKATLFAGEACETNRKNRKLAHFSQPSCKCQLCTCVFGWASAEQWR